MVKQVITIRRKKYAVGLFWQPTGLYTKARNQAIKLARTVDKKLNLYAEYRMMTGVGARSLGHSAGMPSAAAEVAEEFSEYSSFLAAFLIEAKFYIVAVRNGVILIDKIFDDISSARAEYSKLVNIPDWSVLVAPSSWSVPRAIEKLLPDVISGGVHTVLRPISRFRAFITSTFMMAAFVILMLWMFREPIQEMLSVRPQVSKINPQLAEEYKKRIEEKNKELDEKYNIQKNLPVQKVVQPLQLPYKKLPFIQERAEVCYKAIGFLMQPIYGWNQIIVECNETHATAKFRRDFGTLGSFYDVATILMPGAFVQELSDNMLTVRAKLPDLLTRKSIDSRDVDTIMRTIKTLFQAINTPVEIDFISKPITNGVETEMLNVIEVAASSKLTPMNFMDIFSGFGGVYMTRCEWDVARRIWNYEVIIYAKKI